MFEKYKDFLVIIQSQHTLTIVHFNALWILEISSREIMNIVWFFYLDVFRFVRLLFAIMQIPLQEWIWMLYLLEILKQEMVNLVCHNDLSTTLFSKNPRISGFHRLHKLSFLDFRCFRPSFKIIAYFHSIAVKILWHKNLIFLLISWI